MKRYEPTLQWRQGHGQMTDFCKPTVMLVESETGSVVRWEEAAEHAKDIPILQRTVRRLDDEIDRLRGELLSAESELCMRVARPRAIEGDDVGGGARCNARRQERGLVPLARYQRQPVP